MIQHRRKTDVSDAAWLCQLAEAGHRHDAPRTARHLASWAGQCRGNDKSAGKRRSGKTRDQTRACARGGPRVTSSRVAGLAAKPVAASTARD